MLNAVKGPGLRGAVSEAEWDAVEVTFAANRSPVAVDVSPFAESLFFELLRARGYRIGGFENVLYRQIDAANSRPESLKQGWELELVTPARAELWTSIMNRGFSNEGPEPPFSVNFGKVRATLANAMMLLLLIDGAPAAGAALSCSEGVAHFGGAAVLPAYRGRGAQRALTAARIELAHEQGCDVAKLDVLGGSISHRNAAASGFAVAYTRPQMVKTL
jgi:GNAT superfamily N-acetyltransferase